MAKVPKMTRFVFMVSCRLRSEAAKINAPAASVKRRGEPGAAAGDAGLSSERDIGHCCRNRKTAGSAAMP
jgi:hypothetical protein